MIDNDTLWKEIIEELFEDFVAFFMPDLYKDIDFDRGYEFLDKEFAALFPDTDGTKRFADKLAKVYLKSGDERWVLIHVEIQGYRDEEFGKRMFVYFYRIFDTYDKEITAISVFTDDNKEYKPDRY